MARGEEAPPWNRACRSVELRLTTPLYPRESPTSGTPAARRPLRRPPASCPARPARAPDPRTRPRPAPPPPPRAPRGARSRSTGTRSPGSTRGTRAGQDPQPGHRHRDRPGGRLDADELLQEFQAEPGPLKLEPDGEPGPDATHHGGERGLPDLLVEEHLPGPHERWQPGVRRSSPLRQQEGVDRDAHRQRGIPPERHPRHFHGQLKPPCRRVEAALPGTGDRRSVDAAAENFTL